MWLCMVYHKDCRWYDVAPWLWKARCQGGGLVRSELTELPKGSRPYNLSHEAWLPEKQVKVNLPTGSSK